MKIRNPQDFWAGLMFLIIGLGVTWGSKNYDYGTAAKMGPGYFPAMLGGILAVLGAIIVVRSLFVNGEPVGRFHWKPLLMVMLSLALFGVVLQTLGLVIAIFILIIVSSLGGHEFKWKGVLLNAFFLTIGSVAIFNYGLGLQFPVWPW
jgi:hypothetical protein